MHLVKSSATPISYRALQHVTPGSIAATWSCVLILVFAAAGVFAQSETAKQTPQNSASTFNGAVLNGGLMSSFDYRCSEYRLQSGFSWASLGQERAQLKLVLYTPVKFGHDLVGEKRVEIEDGVIKWTVPDSVTISCPVAGPLAKSDTQ